jgi:hypothetical protein
MYPIAKGIIEQEPHISPYAILFALMFGASASVVTPIGARKKKLFLSGVY